MKQKPIAKSDILICCAQNQDIPAWLMLVNQMTDQFPGLNADDYIQTLRKNIAEETALCAKVNDRMIGILLFSRDNLCLLCLAVHPEYRRLGVASKLIAEMVKHMPDGDISVTTFRADDPKGIAPRALYRRLGFVPDQLLTEFHYPVQRFILRRNSSK